MGKRDRRKKRQKLQQKHRQNYVMGVDMAQSDTDWDSTVTMTVCPDGIREILSVQCIPTQSPQT